MNSTEEAGEGSHPRAEVTGANEHSKGTRLSSRALDVVRASVPLGAAAAAAAAACVYLSLETVLDEESSAEAKRWAQSVVTGFAGLLIGLALARRR